MLRTLDLFSGIGGFSLGLERTGGFKTVAFCEIEPFCRRVLAKHWPEVPCYDDVRTLTAERLRTDGIAVDVICGGFPCQDISVAGKQVGIGGERSGLWSEIARLASELRPRFLIVENVAALLGNGLDRVLGDVAALGLDAEWHCIPAAAIGAPHLRDRFWMVAYPAEASGVQLYGQHDAMGRRQHVTRDGAVRAVADTPGKRCREAGRDSQRQAQWSASGGDVLADANRSRFPFAWSLANGAHGQHSGRVPPAGGWWAVELDVGRVAHGVPGRVDRLRALGNAVVPQIPELIGDAILASLAQQEAA